MRTLALICALLAVETVRADVLDGRWSNGSWRDFNSGHTGPLRANFRSTSDGNYRVVFSGRFAKVVPFRYRTTLNVVGQDAQTTYFAGQSRLPLFGRFDYHGAADGQQFNMQFNSRRYTGEFNLSR